MAIKAEISYKAGRLKKAIALAQEAVEYAPKVEGLFTLGLAQRVWGQALVELDGSNWPEAEVHLTASMEAFEAGGLVLEAARTRLFWEKQLGLGIAQASFGIATK